MSQNAFAYTKHSRISANRHLPYLDISCKGHLAMFLATLKHYIFNLP